MKLALVLLMSAVGFGQATGTSKAAEYDQLVLDHSQEFYDNVFVPRGECTDREKYRELQCTMDGACKKRNEKAHWCPVGDYFKKPHKPKPSGAWNYIQTDPCARKGNCAWTRLPDPCDGIACTGPVEMLPRGFPPEGAGIISVPDKAAVPVEPQSYFQFTTISSPSFTIMSQGGDCSWLGFQYDATTKTCSMKITFDVSSQVVCTPLVLNEQGKPEMTCSFKPIDKGGK